MERKRELTKILLAESFKELLIKGSFDKITIKMITDQAGVIRPTFYNYFQDKYEVMEWLLETEVFQHIREMGRHKIKLEKLQGIKDKKIFLEFHTITVVTGLKYWLTSRDIHLSADEAMEYYLFLMSHPILELLEK